MWPLAFSILPTRSSRAIFLPGQLARRLSLGAAVAFLCSLRIAPVRLGAPDHGGPAWMEQFHIHADGLEAQPGILALTIVHSWQKRCEIGTGPKVKRQARRELTPATNTKPL